MASLTILFVSCLSDTWALLKRLCRIDTGPDRSGRLSRAQKPRAHSTDLMAVFSLALASPRLFLSQFPKGHKVQALDVSRLPNTHGSICFLHHLTTAKFSLSHFPVSEGETLLQLGDCLFPDFISSTSNIVDGHSNDAMVFLLCVPQDHNTRLQDACLELQTSACSEETVPPFSRGIGQSTNCF